MILCWHGVACFIGEDAAFFCLFVLLCFYLLSCLPPALSVFSPSPMYLCSKIVSPLFREPVWPSGEVLGR